jgi:hypothetical protein
MDFAETFADLVIFTMLFHTVGGMVDIGMQYTFSRAFGGDDRQAEALESIADTLAELEARLISAPPKKGGK